MMIHEGDVVADYIAQIPVHILVAWKVRVVGLYLKYYNRTYWDAVEAAGIVIVPIFELSPGRALQGAAAGVIDGRNGATKALSFGRNRRSGIIYTHDTSERNSVTDDYFQAAYVENHKQGYTFIDGYWAKGVADAVRALGVPVHLNWAPAAWSWDGGRDPKAQLRQKPSSPVPGFAARWDLGTCVIDVDLYHPWDDLVAPPRPVIPPLVQGKKATKMFTNLEDLTDADVAALIQRGLLTESPSPDDMKALRIFWFLEDNGTERHIKNFTEVVVRGGAGAAQPLPTILLKTFGAA